jgi:hypothetical protein
MNRKSLIINCLSKKDSVIYASFFVEILNFLSAVKIVGNYKITNYVIRYLSTPSVFRAYSGLKRTRGAKYW